MLGSLRWVAPGREVCNHFMSSSNPVADQYSSFPYPEPGDDIPTWLMSFNYDGYDPAKFSVKFWPEGRPKTDLNILVAGCGSMQAAVIAFNNPECRVTGMTGPGDGGGAAASRSVLR
jgi:hypothetical protein